MSDAKSPTEPSIDEILATIRRIISEDEQGAAASAGAGAVAGAVSGGGATSGIRAEVTDETGGIEKAEDGKLADDDILELTEAVNEDGMTRHLAPIGCASSRRAASIAQAAAARPEPPPPRREAPQLRLTPAAPWPGMA